jgi:hypothetical protein
MPDSADPRQNVWSKTPTGMQSGHVVARDCTPADARLIVAAPDLLALARKYASECGNCNGCGFTVGDDGISGRGPDDAEPTRYACEDCADIREVIAKAVRS